MHGAWEHPSALRYYRWLRYAGYRIPQDISLISFDRSDRILPYPISSLDLGHVQLGERPFRFLYGDRNVKLSRLGRIVGVCQINHYGSIAPPASKHLHLFGSKRRSPSSTMGET